MSAYEIFALPVAGGTLALSPLPQGEAVPVLLDWQPDIVISMMAQAEMAKHGAGDLGQVLMRADVIWHQVPVVDYGTPAGADIDRVLLDALACLRAGGRVLAHCRGGCGRSGTMALRIMIAAGEQAETALARLRQVRPCAVETAAQLDWARGAA